MQDRDSLSLTRINMYVITKKNTYDVPNEVYFAYTLVEAMNKQDELHEKFFNQVEWILAKVLD